MLCCCRPRINDIVIIPNEKVVNFILLIEKAARKIAEKEKNCVCSPCALSSHSILQHSFSCVIIHIFNFTFSTPNVLCFCYYLPFAFATLNIFFFSTTKPHTTLNGTERNKTKRTNEKIIHTNTKRDIKQ